MATKRLKRPRDPLQLAKLIGDIATGQVEDRAEDDRDPNAVERGRKGGAVGGKARAQSLKLPSLVVLLALRQSRIQAWLES